MPTLTPAGERTEQIFAVEAILDAALSWQDRQALDASKRLADTRDQRQIAGLLLESERAGAAQAANRTIRALLWRWRDGR